MFGFSVYTTRANDSTVQSFRLYKFNFSADNVFIIMFITCFRYKEMKTTDDDNYYNYSPMMPTTTTIYLISQIHSTLVGYVI